MDDRRPVKYLVTLECVPSEPENFYVALDMAIRKFIASEYGFRRVDSPVLTIEVEESPK